MAQESWDEARYHVLGQLPIINRKIDELDAKVGGLETSFQVGMSALTSKMATIMYVGSIAIGLTIQIASYFLGIK